MKRRTSILAGIILVLLAGVLAFSYSGGSINCENQYNRTLKGDMNISEISEECRPLPEDVENQLLIRSLGG